MHHAVLYAGPLTCGGSNGAANGGARVDGWTGRNRQRAGDGNAHTGDRPGKGNNRQAHASERANAGGKSGRAGGTRRLRTRIRSRLGRCPGPPPYAIADFPRPTFLDAALRVTYTIRPLTSCAVQYLLRTVSTSSYGHRKCAAHRTLAAQPCKMSARPSAHQPGQSISAQQCLHPSHRRHRLHIDIAASSNQSPRSSQLIQPSHRRRPRPAPRMAHTFQPSIDNG
ncbi:uncharacterized protein C8Q71DRAFT_89218 [Rhodofomes roseus]|uniref:Uncharacterized protein n=1 Tax=Rhodofomes roseus TaxID=34475 RepID=A0ABQ8KDY9_9APHY|nr:uncharacterized protein C8Q71DRAFT_89218 [Rhodofomes roseus]KAH9835638.1 hypothetical protein C8Q71DRAFT_89218 [Rhodofomes roseus]